MDNLEKELENLKEIIKTIHGRMHLFDVEIQNIKNFLEDLCDVHQNRIKIPHRCPVCNGGTLDNEGLMCVPCNAKGIVWG